MTERSVAMEPTDAQLRALLKRLKSADATASTFAQSGLAVAELIERLHAPDGERWFARLLAAEPFRPFGPGARELLASGVAIERLVELKEAGKRHFKRAPAAANDARLHGLAAYCLAVAAALGHHGQPIGGRPRALLDPLFLELATAVPEPWSRLLGKAAFAGKP